MFSLLLKIMFCLENFVALNIENRQMQIIYANDWLIYASFDYLIRQYSFIQYRVYVGNQVPAENDDHRVISS